MSRLLRFIDNDTERAFQNQYLYVSRGYLRKILSVYCVLYCSFALIDYLFVREHFIFFLGIRLLLVAPSLIISILLIKRPSIRPYYQLLLSLSMILSGTGIIHMIYHAPAFYPYYCGLMLVLTAGYFTIRLQFTYSLVSGSLITVLFAAVQLLSREIEYTYFSLFLLFFIVQNIVGALGSFYLEKNERKRFTQQLRIDRINRQLEKASRDAADLSEARKLLFSQITHDLRNPLMSILGYTELCAFAQDQEEIHTFLQRIENSTHLLIELIDTSLVSTKLDAAVLEIIPQEFALQEMISDLQNMYSVRVRDSEVGFKIDIADDLPMTFRSDQLRLKQIYMNCISNALKFTDTGQVSISFSLREKELLFVCEDTGIGMSDEQLERVFKKFTQGDSAIAADYGGYGLGMYTSKRLAELLGGDILIASQKGAGTRMTCTVPQLQ